MKRFLVFVSVCAACGGGGDDETYDPQIDPAHFVATVDNQYFPLVPGTVFEYMVQESGEHVVVTVTSDTKVILGVTCVVVHDVADIGGTVIEDTYDWYAQDDQGNVWYMGEDTTAYDGAMTNKEGSWEGGVAGAKPGIVMEGTPQVGDVYRQEYYPGEAEDQGEVLGLNESITVPFGTFTGCVKTKDFSELEPEVVENKWYCPGLGQVAAIAVMGAPEHEELIAVATP
jgi:hypothetical protein